MQYFQTDNQYKMTDVLQMFGHRRIDILKVDIDYGEFLVIPQIFNISDKIANWVNACQLLLEIHPNPIKSWMELLKLIARAGFYMFHREANGGCTPTSCYEYSFMHETCLKEYGIESTKVQRNFEHA